MRKLLIVGVVAVAVAGAAFYIVKREQPAAAADPAQAAGQRPGQRGQGGGPGGGGGGGGFGGPGGGGGFRPPMTVEVHKVGRGRVAQTLSVVGNLIGEATVDVAPRAAGRLTSINVKLGDRLRRGQVIGKIEDREIVEQVNQAEASQNVAQASIRQREADLNLALTNVERSRNLYSRQLLPKQTLDDAEARYTSSVAQVDLAKAQLAQSQSRLDELKINLANTNVISPVDGFVAKRNVDPGAFVSQNVPLVSVVDISSLRLVANVVEKDLRNVNVGDPGIVEVDAFPGEKFKGRIARVAPILDPATRTAPMEIEIRNSEFRLKPGMYAKVSLEVEQRENVLVIPKISLVDSEGKRGIYIANEENRAQFKPVTVGIENNEIAEITEGLHEGEVIVSTGAGALRRNDQLVVAGAEGQRGPRGGPSGGQGQGGRQGMGGRRPAGQGGQGGQGGPGAGAPNNDSTNPGGSSARPQVGPGGQRPPREGQAPSGQQQQGRPPRTPQQLASRPIA